MMLELMFYMQLNILMVLKSVSWSCLLIFVSSCIPLWLGVRPWSRPTLNTVFLSFQLQSALKHPARSQHTEKQVVLRWSHLCVSWWFPGKNLSAVKTTVSEARYDQWQHSAQLFLWVRFGWTAPLISLQLRGLTVQQRLPVVKHPHCTGKHHLEQGTLWAPTGSGALPESYCALELELSSFDLFTLSQTVITVCSMSR